MVIYSLGSCTDLYAGLISFLPATSSSILWAHQPESLAVANSGVAMLKGMSSASYTKPEYRSTLAGIGFSMPVTSA